jgi:hypothetical protein
MLVADVAVQADPLTAKKDGAVAVFTASVTLFALGVHRLT